MNLKFVQVNNRKYNSTPNQYLFNNVNVNCNLQTFSEQIINKTHNTLAVIYFYSDYNVELSLHPYTTMDVVQSLCYVDDVFYIIYYEIYYDENELHIDDRKQLDGLCGASDAFNIVMVKPHNLIVQCYIDETQFMDSFDDFIVLSHIEALALYKIRKVKFNQDIKVHYYSNTSCEQTQPSLILNTNVTINKLDEL